MSDKPYFCQECVKAGVKSRVYVGGSSSQCMGWQAYYDEDGIYHSHDPNLHSTYYSCSNGHTWAISIMIPCRSCEYGDRV